VDSLADDFPLLKPKQKVNYDHFASIRCSVTHSMTDYNKIKQLAMNSPFTEHEINLIKSKDTASVNNLSQGKKITELNCDMRKIGI